jgi:glycosyltransferase involved in cell wall biosynthesis
LKVGEFMKDARNVRYVTFFRAPFVEPYSSFAREMRRRGSRIVFDIDDLIFDEDQIPIIDGFRHLSDVEKVGYRRGVRAYRDFVLYADFCTAPTEFLADQMRLLGKRAFRVRNTIDENEIERFRCRTPRHEQRELVIGYYSGSKTHQADFRNAGEALARFMEEKPDARFRLVGQFDLGEYPALNGNARVTTIGPMAHSDMLEDQLHCDVVIAPLEVGNPFCEAKSELKFFEASLVRRPVIVSRTGTFRTATLDGELAQLADKPNEWLDAFQAASRNQIRFRGLADRAHDYVVENYCPAAAGRDAVLAYSDTAVE